MMRGCSPGDASIGRDTGAWGACGGWRLALLHARLFPSGIQTVGRSCLLQQWLLTALMLMLVLVLVLVLVSV